MNRPLTHEVKPALQQRLRAVFVARGHAPATNPKNEYIAFEVRTTGRSIFTLYTSGKLVSTLRDGDAEAAVLAAEVSALLDGAPPAGARRAGDAGAGDAGAAGEAATPAAGRGLQRGTRRGLHWLAGVDETGTGELLGSAVLGGALLPTPLADAVDRIAGHVETKTSRAASGWALLGEQLAGLRADGLHLCALPIGNRLFDAWSKNGLLDLAYVRLVGDLLASAGLARAESLAGLELVIDDYGTGALLQQAIEAWHGRGALVLVQTRADDRHLAARIASVVARSTRSREKAGLDRRVTDGPLGTGNAGHRETLRWLRRHAATPGRAPGSWPPFVKASFRTARALDGLPDATKRRVPALAALLDDAAARDFLRGRLDVGTATLRAADGAPLRVLDVTAEGALRAPAESCLAWELLPVLCGGFVLDDSACAPDVLERLLDPDAGLLAGLRVLVGPREAAGERAGARAGPGAGGAGDSAALAALAALAHAHREGTLVVVPTAVADPLERARRHAGVLVSARPGPEVLALRLVD